MVKKQGYKGVHIKNPLLIHDGGRSYNINSMVVEGSLEIGEPFEIKDFIWLAMDKKILTWDNFQKRSWVGPSRCYYVQKQWGICRSFVCQLFIF
jgi:hypothetical protein